MCRILLADDDPCQIELHALVLETAGHQVCVALSASEALRRFDREHADLVVMDLRFPNALGTADAGEGLRLIRSLRQRGCATPVIVLCGWPDEIYGTEEERMVSRVIEKPVAARTLLDAIATFAGASQGLPRGSESA